MAWNDWRKPLEHVAPPATANPDKPTSEHVTDALDILEPELELELAENDLLP